jgi:hypothetical protein
MERRPPETGRSIGPAHAAQRLLPGGSAIETSLSAKAARIPKMAISRVVFSRRPARDCPMSASRRRLQPLSAQGRSSRLDLRLLFAPPPALRRTTRPVFSRTHTGYRRQRRNRFLRGAKAAVIGAMGGRVVVHVRRFAGERASTLAPCYPGAEIPRMPEEDDGLPSVRPCDTAQSRFHSQCPSRCPAEDRRHS